ncbi:MAG: diaminopimelate dehydrogenase [Clostridia bacterium]|nr:diaminopimelate dehydrogenase [Clostridia bacterium]
MKLAIYGYGNLGKAAEINAKNFPDIEVTGVYTRRDPKTVTTIAAPVYSVYDILAHKDEIDVLFIAGGSATDLPVMTPALAKNFNVIDSFDNHTHIAEHFAAVDAAAKENGNIALISAGWDPGMFSIARVYAEAILPNGTNYTFWGKGVSQGHSDACRRIEGVADARQYTIPKPEALDAVRAGNAGEQTARTMHTREVFVVAKEGADKAKIEEQIKHMPDYFEGYETTVNFITAEEMQINHAGLPHGGFVIRSGNTGIENEKKHTIEYNLQLDSNPEFTSSVILAYARAIDRMHKEGQTGCKTVFDVAPKYLSAVSEEEMRAHLL